MKLRLLIILSIFILMSVSLAQEDSTTYYDWLGDPINTYTIYESSITTPGYIYNYYYSPYGSWYPYEWLHSTYRSGYYYSVSPSWYPTYNYYPIYYNSYWYPNRFFGIYMV